MQRSCFQSNANFLNLVLQRTKDGRTTKVEAQNRRTKTKRDRQEANARKKTENTNITSKHRGEGPKQATIFDFSPCTSKKSSLFFAL